MSPTVPATGGVTHRLAEFALSLDLEKLPESVRHAGRRTFGNALSLAVGAARHPAVNAVVSAAQHAGTPPIASIPGRGERLGLTWACLAAGIAAHVEDYDDTHLRTVVHPGAPIVPAALVAAEWRGASGADLLAATIAGTEVALRVGNGICPGHFDRGWHLTGTAGHIGAAAAAARLLGLDVAGTVVAIGLGATQAAGLTAALGTMTKPFHPGKAAADGIEAALLARRGLTGPPAPIEGRRGFAPLAAPEVDIDEMLRGLGLSWEIELNAFKPYACGIVSHAIIDAAIELRDVVADPADVADVQVIVHPVVLDVMGVAAPSSGLESKFSAYHCFAVGFVDGAGGPRQFSDARATAHEVVDLRRKVTVVPDESVAKGAAEVRLRLRDSEERRACVTHAAGSAERPMTDEQLRTKAAALVEPILGDRTGDFLDAAFGPDALPAAAALTESSRPVGTSR